MKKKTHKSQPDDMLPDYDFEGKKACVENMPMPCNAEGTAGNRQAVKGEYSCSAKTMEMLERMIAIRATMEVAGFDDHVGVGTSSPRAGKNRIKKNKIPRTQFSHFFGWLIQ